MTEIIAAVLGALLAFAFGFVLQYWLVIRQERFQKQLLADQRAHEERMEEQHGKEARALEQIRIETERVIAAEHRQTLRQIALDNRNFESFERTRDRLDRRT